MKYIEQCISEAIGNYFDSIDHLDSKSEYGLDYHKKTDHKNERAHTKQYQDEYIRDKFRIEALKIDVVYYDSITSMFSKVISYKDIDDPSFNLALKKEYDAIPVPKQIQDKIFVVIDNIIKEITSSPKSNRKDKLGHEEFTNSATQPTKTYENK